MNGFACESRKDRLMGKSFEFKECERFLKRVLKDKGMYSKGAVIAFLITGGIGFVAPVLVGQTVQAKPGYTDYVITDPRTGETVTEGLGTSTYFADGYHSVILANSRSDAAGTDGIYGRLNRRAVDSVIIGNNATGFGLSNTDSESKFTIVGNNARAFGGQGTAIGSNTLAAKQATAIGNDVYAAGASSVAIGNDDISTKYRDSLSIATLKSLYGDGAAADAATAKMFRESNWYSSKADNVGKYKITSWGDFQRSYFQDKDADRIYSPTYAGGTGAIAVGSRSIAAQDGSTAIGTLSYALGEGSTAMGLRAYTDSVARGAVAIGEESRSFAPQSLAVGNHNESSEQGAMSYGYNAKAVGQGSIAIGYNIFANAAINNDIAEKDGNSATNTLRQAVRSNLETYSETQLAALGKYQAAVADYYEKLGNPKKYSKAVVATAKQAMDDERAKVDDFTKYGDVNYLKLVRGGFSGQQGYNTTKNTITSVVNEVKKNPLTVAQNNSVYLTTTDTDGNTKQVTKSANRGDNAIAIGYYSAASGSASIAQGAGSVVDADSGIGIGSLSYVSEKSANSIAIGVGAQVRKENSIAIGTQASVYGAGAMGLGSGARVYGDNSLAFGYGSVIQSRGSVALGNASKVAMGAQNATSLGANTEIGINSGNSVTVGNTASIGDEALNSMALGYGANVGKAAAKSIAFGTNATIAANATSSVALGDSAKVTVASSTALGRLAEATNENSVALGYRSTTHYYGNPDTREASASDTKTATNVQGMDIKPYLPQGSKLGDKLDKLDGATAGFVSVGGWVDKDNSQIRGLRRIVNVAPGALDTDAVTVAQLRDWTDKSAHFLSIAGASNKEATDFPDINDPMGTKVKNEIVKIKSNFDNDTATGTHALALGVYAYANGEKSVALGPNSYANVDHGVAIGNNAQAWSEGSNGNSGVAIGKDAKAYYWNALALGTNSNVSGWHSLALGANARVGVVKTVDADGNVTNPGTKVNDGIAIGRDTAIDGNGSVALGAATKVTTATNAVAIGTGANVLAGTDANNKAVQATGAVAIGSNASVTGSQYSVALGLNSSVVQDDTKAPTKAAFTNENINDPGNGVVSVGNNSTVKRRIINVASGVNDNDAVTVKQLKSAVRYYKTNATDTANRTVNTIADVSANYNGEGATGTASVTLGSYTQASGNYSTAIGRDVITTGSTAVGIGTNVSAFGNSSVALGNNAIAGYTKTEDSKTVPVGATEGVAIGNSSTVQSSYAIAIGGNAKVLRDASDTNNIKDPESSVAIGAGAQVTGAKYSVALGLNSRVNAADTATKTTAAFSGEVNDDPGYGVVSVGQSGKYRRILNVAGGVNDNDAVNVKQLRAAAWGLKTQSGTAAAADVTPDADSKVTLKAGNNVTIDNANGVVTINATGIQSVSSGNTNALGVTTTNGAVTITPNLAGTITGTGNDANKLVTAGVVNTALNAKANVSDLAAKVDKTAELHVRAGDYTARNGEVSLIQEDATGTQNNSKGFKIKNIATGDDITNINTTLAGKADKSYVDTQIGTVSNLGYKAAGETDKQVAVGTGLTFKPGTGTVGATGANAATTNAATPKTGIAISTENGGIVNIGLDAATRSAIDNAATKSYVDTQIGNTANKNLSNLNTAGEEKVKDLAAAAVKVAPGKNVTVTGATTNHVTTYTVDAIDTTVAAGDGLSVSGGDTVDTATNKRNYTVALSADTKAKLAKVDTLANTVGTIGVDGRDGKSGTGANAGMGKDGLTKEDGLNGKDLTTKVNALRNGEAGTVVYTDENGKRVVKANDGKWYPAEKVDAKGNKLDGATEVATPQARLVNPDGTTTGGTTKLSNIADGTIGENSKDAINGGQLHTELAKKADVTALAGKVDKAAELHVKADTYKVGDDGVVTVKQEDGTGAEATGKEFKISGLATKTDITNINTALGQKANAADPITFTGDDAQAVTRALGTTLTVKGATNFTPSATTPATEAGVNIRVEKDPTTNANGLVVKLADTLTNMKGISGNGTDPLTIKNGDNAVITVKPGAAGAKGDVDFGGSKLTNIGTPGANTDAANKAYVDTKFGNAANKDLDNLNDAGKAAVKDLAAEAVKIAQGKNVTVTPKTTDHVTTYTVDAIDTTVAAGEGLSVSGGDTVDTTTNKRNYTVALSQDTKDTLAKVQKAVDAIGTNGSDGRDGKPGTGADAGMGKDG